MILIGTGPSMARSKQWQHVGSERPFPAPEERDRLVERLNDPLAGRYLDLPGVHLWYLDTAGAGTPLVFLHANSATSAIWAAQLHYFAAMGFRGIAMDRRGWGNSTANPITGLQPGSVADDLDALVSALELDRFHLVGVAGGTFSAIDYAAWRPERVITLV